MVRKIQQNGSFFGLAWNDVAVGVRKFHKVFLILFKKKNLNLETQFPVLGNSICLSCWVYNEKFNSKKVYLGKK